ncbi:hypothetical protein C8J56DRAFT_977713 [Mycena floridula]|nr:hypothetical protein C8J56DRAFT_977713 [Mycena floridula]
MMVTLKHGQESEIPQRTNPCPSCGHWSGNGALSDDDAYLRTARVQELLGSNQPPRDEEIIKMRANHAKKTDLLRSYDEAIQRLEQSLDVLKQERVKVKGQLEQYATLTSVVRRLPDDILRQIFSASIDYFDWKDDIQVVEKMTKPRDTLIQICQQWRDVGTQHGTLWQAIVVCLTAEAKFSAGLRLGHQLARSGGDTPLYIWITADSDCKKDDPLLSILLPTSLRWRTLVVVLPNATFLSPIRGFLRSLNSLSFGFMELTPVDHVFEFAPQLQCLRTRSDYSPWRLPWSQITNYRDHSTSDLIPALNMAVNLTYLIICFPENVISTPITLMSLRKLSIQYNGITMPDMSNLNVPNLENLSVYDDPGKLQDVIDLLNRCKPPLKQLAISSNTTSEILIKLLAKTPQLISLELWAHSADRFYENNMLSKFKFPIDGRDILAPCLQELLLSEPISATSRTLFCDMIRNRTAHGVTMLSAGHISGQSLISVTLVQQVDFDEQDLQILRECLPDGLTFWNGNAQIK